MPYSISFSCMAMVLALAITGFDGRQASTTRRKYAYHFQRLQMANFLRLLMVGLFPPCSTRVWHGTRPQHEIANTLPVDK
ncbi:MAG: hypothetical protein V7K83_02020 [Nostoc sp.]